MTATAIPSAPSTPPAPKDPSMVPPRSRNNTPLREIDDCGIACSGLAAVHRDYMSLKQEQEEVHAEYKMEKQERKEEQSRRTKWLVGALTGILIPAAVAMGSTLIGIGKIQEQQQTMRENVNALLTVSRRLDHDNTVSDSALRESARDREALHEYDHNLELKIWELQTRSSGVHMPTPTPGAPATTEPSPP